MNNHTITDDHTGKQLFISQGSRLKNVEAYIYKIFILQIKYKVYNKNKLYV